MSLVWESVALSLEGKAAFPWPGVDASDGYQVKDSRESGSKGTKMCCQCSGDSRAKAQESKSETSHRGIGSGILL